MRKLGRQLLAGPYLVWIIGFILLPIVIILYYAFTNTSGAFTLGQYRSDCRPGTCKIHSAFLKARIFLYSSSVCCLPIRLR